MRSPHILLALSPHGYGHGAMTAPILAELTARLPGRRLTIQTRLPNDWLQSRYGPDFTLIDELPDFGLVMHDANSVDVQASLDRYDALFARLPAIVAAETDRIARLQPDLVLANIPFVTIIAARRADVPVVALSSLNWADILENYAGGAAMDHVAAMRRAYQEADLFLRMEPGLPVEWLPDAIGVGPAVRAGIPMPGKARAALGVSAGTRLGLLAFGGMDAGIDAASIAAHPDWHSILGQGSAPDRPDMSDLSALEMGFSDLIASVDAIVTKPGYGMFTEAAANGRPFLYLERPDWPETPYLVAWARRHVPCAQIARGALSSLDLPARLDALLQDTFRNAPSLTGAADSAEHILRLLRPAPAD